MIFVSSNALFHVRRCRLLRLCAALLCLIVFLPYSASAEPSDGQTAEHIVKLLAEKFTPESISVTVKDSYAFAEMKGAVLSKIRIDTMKLDAILINRDKPLSDDVKALSSLIGYSKGEIVLLEKDVNDYFLKNTSSGFSNLVFDFKPDGFRADGLFTASFIVTLRIRLAATGVLNLKPDGVYLGNVAIFVEKMKQPDSLIDQIISRINPLIEWSDVPFKVEFKKITMDDRSATMTGDPKKLTGGSTAVWERK